MYIGFAGLGRMGVPMAARLIGAGHTVIAYDVYLTGTAALPAALQAGNTRVASSPAQLAATDISISMLPNAAITESVLFGPNGILTAAGPGHVHVVMGTVGPAAVRDFAQRAAQSKIVVADAPVSGSVSLAQTGELTAMVGADPDLFQRLQPLLATMSHKQFHVGPPGAGSAAKLAVNSVLAALNQGIAEAIVMAQAGGVAPGDLYQVLDSSAVSAPYVDYKRQNFLDPDGTAVAFALSLLRKDVALGLELAGQYDLDLPQAQTVGRVLDRAVDAGLGDHDMAAVLKLVRGDSSTAGRLRRQP
ncbi:3-hydroxyisobutyrate dehydrogenase [Mycobacteroides immunogenum]|uniref:3-hydroxyisobutyrate dehydrogenase n=1 Tax=Mycobacteroides immunogenum TaxID=83262 RepID=A0A179V5L4_9MYCO|nr:NAD(P)-dependent oxidoreductase [Mycobacteroides immunogenum]OAT66265.1 3-hydroxyisobutyrate dehydrogenase [Mycobacteroides immunogenum]